MSGGTINVNLSLYMLLFPIAIKKGGVESDPKKYKDINKLEQVQLKTTKMVQELRHLTKNETLRELCLFGLRCLRRVRIAAFPLHEDSKALERLPTVVV